MPETDRMALRRANWPDVDDIVALNADAEVMRYRHDGHPMTAAGVLTDEMPRLMAHNARTDQLGYWVARDHPTDGFLGWFAVIPVDEPVRTVQLDYRLRRRAWGKGFGIEGTLRMIEMARAAGVATVIATAMADDAEYREVMENAGLQLVRTWDDDRLEPVAPGEPGEVSYTLDLSASATRQRDLVLTAQDSKSRT